MSRLFPAAKINLGLRITGRRRDGFHELTSLIIPLPQLHDILEIEEGGRAGLELECGCDAITDLNILHKTYEVFGNKKAFFPPLRARLEKRIPVGAGLGGGSSDAAFFLRYLARLCPEPTGEKELLSLGMSIGADVPFFLVNRPACVSGTGELVNPLKSCLPHLHLLLVWPGLHISTSWAFRAFDLQNDSPPNSSAGKGKKDLTKPYVKATQIFPAQDFSLQDIISSLRNDLEYPVFESYPLLGELKRELIESGALASGMSGSGSSVYGIFPDQEMALTAAAELRKKYKTVYQIST